MRQDGGYAVLIEARSEELAVLMEAPGLTARPSASICGAPSGGHLAAQKPREMAH
jgi:hypothetical protein